MLEDKLKKKSIQKVCQSKFNKERQIKRTKITKKKNQHRHESNIVMKGGVWSPDNTAHTALMTQRMPTC